MKSISIVCIIISSLTTSLAHSELETLDRKLANSESRYTDIVTDTNKVIIWASNKPVKTPYSIVYVHGFSASRQELSPTTELLAENLGANVFYARLRGHGRSDDAMTDGSVPAWKEDVREAFEIGKKLGDKVILISASTGSTLTTWLQSTDLEGKLAANIMISPNFGVKNSSAKFLTWPGGLRLAKWLNGDYRSFTPINQKHALYWTERYPIEAVLPMLELVEEVDELDKSNMTAPQLFIYSQQDRVVDIERIKETATEFTSAKVSTYIFTQSTDPSQHVLSGDACSPSSTMTMVELLSRYIKNHFTLK